MKTTFNTNWKRSKQPRKQIKYRANAPKHTLRKFMSAPLAKSLRQRYGKRNLQIRKGDEVKILRGTFKGKQGKITVIDTTNTRIQINGIERKKKGGEKLETWINPTNTLIIAPDTNDEKRFKKKQEETKTEKKEIKTDKEETKKKTKEKDNAHKKK